MSVVNCVEHIFEPNPLACGQAVLAMLTGVNVNKIIELCGTEKETDLKCMKRILSEFNIKFNEQRVAVTKKEDLPKIALLSLETPICWHWSLYFDGLFYDPQYGILEDFPPSNRRYYWQIYN